MEFEESYVKGTVDIDVKGVGGSLSLDAVDMDIGTVQVNGRQSKFKFDRSKGSLTIPGVPKKHAVVRVGFTKRVADDALVGLYKSKYGDGHFLATDLEPARARSVFPCRDDPSYKAVFDLSVVTRRDLSVISNAPLDSKKELPGGKAKFTFEPTPRMSTYLFFLGVGRFEETRKKSGGIDFIVASRPGQAKKAKFALDEASAILDKYSDYFSISYPLRKLHLVALPEYRAGAMENWGAITFREGLLLVDSGSTISDRRGVSHVSAHEIAHQWFGDLVTMRWWDDLWLNESFATFMDHKVLEELHPEWDNWREFLLGSTFPALKADALSDTHPIETRVRKVEEIEGIFNAIVYGKGASVLRMIEAYVGEGDFRKGISEYLHRFRYSNAEGADLWNSLGRASGLPVSKLAHAWVTMPGFPVVRVTTSKGRLNFSQARFKLRGEAKGEVWPIPLTFAVDGKIQRMLLDRASASVKIKPGGNPIVNPRRTGFYSVLYDHETYSRIAEEFARLHPHDRAGIMNDLYIFMLAGMAEPALYFRFVSLCGDILDPMTAGAVVDQMVNLRAIADEAPVVRRSYSHFYRSQYKVLGLHAKKGDEETIGELRETVLTQLARTDVNFARDLSPLFDHYASVEPDLKSAVAVSYAIAEGEGAFGTLVKLIKSEKSETERVRLYRAVTSLPDSGLVKRVLELSASGEVSRSDSVYVASLSSANPNARSALWEWLTENYSLLAETYGIGGALQTANSIVPRCGVELESEVHTFFSGTRFKEGKDTFKRTFELLGVNSALRKKLLAQ